MKLHVALASKSTTISMFILLMVGGSILVPPSHVGAVGDISMDTVITSNPQPTLTGSGMLCTASDGHDVDVTIANVYAQGTQMMTFSTATGQVQTSTDGWATRYWSLDLEALGVYLPQGYYDVHVGFCRSTSVAPFGVVSFYYPSDTFNNAIQVIPAACDVDCIPIYRYYNLVNGAHVYTTSDAEKRQLFYTSVFRYEGVVGFALDAPYDGGAALHRFYNKANGTHFYTTNQTEATYVNDNLYGTYTKPQFTEHFRFRIWACV
jgi:hypothetical protein